MRRRTARLSAAACLAAVSAMPAHAQAVGRFTANGSYSEGYSTNPLLTAEGGRQSIFAEVSVSPNYVLSMPGGTTSLGGHYSRTQYITTGDFTQSYGVAAEHSRRLDALTQLGVTIVYDSSIPGERQPFFATPVIPSVPDPVVVPTDPNTPPTEVGPQPGFSDLIDPTLVGSRQRRSSLSVAGDLSTRLSSLETVSAHLSAGREFGGDARAAEFKTVSGSASYSRTLDASSSVGAEFSVTRSFYEDDNPLDSSTISPRLTYSARVGSAFTMSASLGVTMIRSRTQGNSSALAGSLNACRNGERDVLCISASRDATAYAIGGVRKQLGAGLNYSYRFARYDTITASVSYSHYGGAFALDSGGDNLETSVAWGTLVFEGVSGGISLSLRDRMRNDFSQKADFNGQVYLSFPLWQ